MLEKFKILAVPVILILLFILLAVSAKSESRVFDEITEVNAGYQFLIHQDFRYDPFNPPLARELIAIPLLVNKSFINDPTLFWPRLIVIIFTLFLGVLVYKFADRLYGRKAGVLALILFSLEPNILSNGHYAQTDLIFAFFLVLAFYVYFLWRKKFTLKRTIIFGALIGFLLSTKTTALPFFFLPFALLLIYDYGINKLRDIRFWKKNHKHILFFTLSCLFFLWSTYFFKFEPMLGYRFDPNRPTINIAKTDALVHFALYQPVPLGSFLSTIKQEIVFNYSGLYRRDSMILGNVSNNGQSGLYFIPLILIKIPWEILALFAVALYLYKKKIRESLIILIPLLSILAEILLTNTVIVIRYILPIIPLIIIYASQIVNFKYRYKILALTFVLVLLCAETFSVFPHFISYINLSLGGYKNGYKYVFDSNYDWGQGLLDLKNYQKVNNLKNLNLAYFGDMDPSSIGIKYNPIFNSVTNYRHFDLSKMEIRENSTYAISETCWYLCGYYKLPAFSGEKIKDTVGGSILIFKF